jgi:hypothetical protein
MIDHKTKNNYKDLIHKLFSETSIVNPICEFIDTYDGTKDDDFHGLFICILSLLTELSELRIVEKGYNEIIKNSDDMESNISRIVQKYKELEEDKEPEQPAVPSD